MLITNLHKRFGGSSETVRGSDPFGAGMTFEVRRAGWPPFVRYMAETAGQGVDNDAMNMILGEIAADAMESGADELRLENSEIQRRMAEKLRSGKVRLPGAMTESDRRARGLAEHLLVSWEGVLDEETGEPVPCEPELAFQLLTYAALVEGDPKRRTVGQVLTDHLYVLAEGKEVLHVEGLEKLEGNSEPSSAGAVVPSEN